MRVEEGIPIYFDIFKNLEGILIETGYGIFSLRSSKNPIFLKTLRKDEILVECADKGNLESFRKFLKDYLEIHGEKLKITKINIKSRLLEILKQHLAPYKFGFYVNKETLILSNRIHYSKINKEKMIENLNKIIQLLDLEAWLNKSKIKEGRIIDEIGELIYHPDIEEFNKKLKMDDLSETHRWTLILTSKEKMEFFTPPSNLKLKERMRRAFSIKIDYPIESETKIVFPNSLETFYIYVIAKVPRFIISEDIKRIFESCTNDMPKFVNALKAYDNQFDLKFKFADTRLVSIREGVMGHWIAKKVSVINPY